MENFALQTSPCSFLNSRKGPWEIPFPFVLCSFSLSLSLILPWRLFLLCFWPAPLPGGSSSVSSLGPAPGGSGPKRTAQREQAEVRGAERRAVLQGERRLTDTRPRRKGDGAGRPRRRALGAGGPGAGAQRERGSGAGGGSGWCGPWLARWSGSGAGRWRALAVRAHAVRHGSGGAQSGSSAGKRRAGGPVSGARRAGRALERVGAEQGSAGRDRCAPRTRAGVRGWAGVCAEGPGAERHRRRWLGRSGASANVERADAGAREACATACAGASSVVRWRARGGVRELVERDVMARTGASGTQRAGVQALGGRRTGSASSAGTRVRAWEWRDKTGANVCPTAGRGGAVARHARQ
jgi:hypothetical protein